MNVLYINFYGIILAFSKVNIVKAGINIGIHITNLDMHVSFTAYFAAI
jgi:hypothetical protein